MISTDFGNSFVAISTLLLLGLGITLIVGRWGQALRPCLASFALHIGVSAFLYYYHGLGALGPDAISYDALANSVGQSLAGQGPGVSYAEGKEGWLYVLGALYYLFGHVPETGLIVIATLVSLLPAIMASTSRLMGWAGSANAAAWLAVIMPSLIIWPSSILREGPSIFLLSLMVLSAGLYRGGRAVLAGLLLAGSTLGMMWIRPPMGIAALVGIALAAIIVPRRRPIGSVAAIAFLAPSLLAIPFGLLRGNQLTFSGVGTLRANLSIGASTSTGASSEGFDTTTGTILGSVRDLPGAAFGPFPWEAIHQPWTLAVDGLTFVGLAYLVFLAIRNRGTRREAISLVIPAITILFVVAAVFGNYGFVVRQRTQALPFILPVAAVGWQIIQRRRVGLDPPVTSQVSRLRNV